MKKQLFLIGLIFTMFVAYSQTTETKDETQPTATADTQTETKDDFCPHRILLRFGSGYANNMYKEFRKENIAKTCSYNVMAELGYTYFFHRNVGIGLGVGINKVGRIAKINDSQKNVIINDIFYDINNPDYEYLMDFTFKDFTMRHHVWAIEVPLSLQFEKKFGGRNGIYAGIGIKGYFPISSTVSAPKGNMTIDLIHGKDVNAKYIDLVRWQEDFHVGKKSVKQKMRPSVDIFGEFGGIFGIARNTDIYLGLYASYGFLNIFPKEGIDVTQFDNVVDHRFSQMIDNEKGARRYVKTTDKWNLFQVGLKIGFHFLPCKSCGNDEYMNDAKRAYMKKMMAKKDEPIIITNTVQEYYYFVPTISQELLDESSPDKKKALLDLAQSLSNIKILFDLDKDIPKFSDKNKEDIKRAAEVLKANSDFKVIVTGYTSPEGSVAHNKDLGRRRAEAVRKVFINEGVPADQITTQNFTAEDEQHKIDIPDKEWPQQRAVIFKIEKR